MKETQITDEKDIILETKAPKIFTFGIKDSEITDNPKEIIKSCTISTKISRELLLSTAAQLLSYLHPILAYGIYLVVPYYVLSTPNLGWNVNDLGFIFSSIALGEIVGSQTVPLAAVLDSNLALFIGHFIQLLSAFIGYFLMSGIITHNYWIFVTGMFCVGFSYATSCVQAYSTEIAQGDEILELRLMSNMGQWYIAACLTSAFVLPPIYQYLGFDSYCLFNMVLAVIAVCALFTIVIGLTNKAYEMDSENKDEKVNNKEEFADTDGEDDEEENLNSSNIPKKSVINRSTTITSKNLDEVRIPLLSILSPSMYALLALKVVQCFSFQVYAISYPVIFNDVFLISPSIGGYLYAAGAIFGICGLFTNEKIKSIYDRWEYPWDVVLYFSLMFFVFISYVIFYDSWVAYAYHWLALGSILTLSAIEMKTRLFLCPAMALQRVTGLVGVLQACTYLSGSLIAPALLSYSYKLPFLVIALMSLASAIAAAIVYVLRMNFLSGKFVGNTKASYLTKERAYYHSIKKSAARRGGLVQREDNELYLDQIGNRLQKLQVQISKRRSIQFLLNPNASSRLEAFVNCSNAIENDEECKKDKYIVESSTNSNNLKNNCNKKQLPIVNERRGSIFMNLGNTGIKHKKRMSIARKSIFHGCNTAIALHDNDVEAEAEVRRRTRRMSTSRASMFLNR